MPPWEDEGIEAPLPLICIAFHILEERSDNDRCVDLGAAHSNFKRFFKLRTLRTLSSIFMIMAQQTEIGRAQ